MCSGDETDKYSNYSLLNWQNVSWFNRVLLLIFRNAFVLYVFDGWARYWARACFHWRGDARRAGPLAPPCGGMLKWRWPDSMSDLNTHVNVKQLCEPLHRAAREQPREGAFREILLSTELPKRVGAVVNIAFFGLQTFTALGNCRTLVYVCVCSPRFFKKQCYLHWDLILLSLSLCVYKFYNMLNWDWNNLHISWLNEVFIQVWWQWKIFPSKVIDF